MSGKITDFIKAPQYEPVTVYTDGGCKGNPGPGGWGVYIIYHDKKTIKLNGKDEHTTNNKMELMATIKALEMLKKEKNIILYTDSTYVKNGITKWVKSWEKNGWKTSQKKDVKNKELWVKLNDLSSGRNIEWKWVKGHSGNHGNEIADKLAQY